MRIGAALPSNVFRLEYTYFLEQEFGKRTLDFAHAGYMALDRNAEHTIDETLLRVLWDYDNNVTESLTNGVYLIVDDEEIPRLYTTCSFYVGWWKFRIKLNGTIGSGDNQIFIIRGDYYNAVLLQIGINNALKLVKRAASVPTDIIDCGINLTTGTWFDVEVTRDADGNYEVWVDTVSKGTALDAYLPPRTTLQFEGHSSVGMYIKEVYMDYERHI